MHNKQTLLVKREPFFNLKRSAEIKLSINSYCS